VTLAQAVDDEVLELALHCDECAAADRVHEAREHRLRSQYARVVRSPTAGKQ